MTRTYRNQDNNVYAFGVGTLCSYDYHLYGNAYGNPDLGSFYIDPALPDDTSYEFDYQTNAPQNTFICTNDYRFAGAKLYQFRNASYTSADGFNYMVVMKDGTKYDFNGAGYLCAIRDANNNTLLIDRGGSLHGNPLSIVQPSGRSVSLAYNGSLVARATDSAGRSVGYVYDSSSRLGHGHEHHWGHYAIRLRRVQ